MGFFTYSQTKKTKREVAGLRRDQADQARQVSVQQAAAAQEQARAAANARNLALFQALPAEAKEEYRALDDAFNAVVAEYERLWRPVIRYSAHSVGPQVPRQDRKLHAETLGRVNAARAQVFAMRQALYRRYDLIP